MSHKRNISAAIHLQPEGLPASWLWALIACVAVHRAQWPEALKQEVYVRFRNHCELTSVLSNVRPGPADMEGGWQEDDGDDEVRGDTLPSCPCHIRHAHYSVCSNGKGD